MTISESCGRNFSRPPAPPPMYKTHLAIRRLLRRIQLPTLRPSEGRLRKRQTPTLVSVARNLVWNPLNGPGVWERLTETTRRAKNLVGDQLRGHELGAA